MASVDWNVIHAEERAGRPDALWLDVDLTSRDLYRDGFPHELFQHLRGKSPMWRHHTAPTRRSPDGVAFWAVLGHPEVQQVSRDWRRFSSIDGLSLTTTAPENRGHTIVSTDPPAHTRIRGLVNAGFTPRMIARLDELIAQRATQVLDVAAAKNDINFVADIAYPLPMHVISDIIGIPESDRPDVFRWTDTIMRAPDPNQGISHEDASRAERNLFAYGADLGAHKRRRPADDVWSRLATAQIDDDGQPTSLSPAELDQFFLILTIAGSETTRNVIAGALVALDAHPDQKDLLRNDPRHLPTAVEEMIRWTSPVTCHLRTATTDHIVSGQHIRAGDRVAMFFPSANRDTRGFSNPERLDIRRDPNPHVSFGGGGVHYCLGAHLARREIAVVFEQLLSRFPNAEITGPLTHVVAGPEETVATSLADVPVKLLP